MKHLIVSLLLTLAPYWMQAQKLDVEGKARISDMEEVNTADSVVIRMSDGTLGVRDVSTLPDADSTNELQQLSINGDTIFITNGGYLVIPGLSNVHLIPTCNDLIQNGDEEGVDCGGNSCISCAERCSDGILNGDEEEVDCGGSACDPCPTCDDGLKNGQELAIDCGGPECPPCSLDIIIVVDNSGSMDSEIDAIESTINSFASILTNAGKDWRIVLISEYSADFCIPPPLGGPTCGPTPNNTTDFYHYSTSIASNNSLTKILNTYASADDFNLFPTGWQDLLRSNSLKVFLEFTDDDASLTAMDFDTALVTLSPEDFGTLEDRNYKFYSIIGVSEAGSPHPPTDPIILTSCAMGVDPGATYQELSILTGRDRYAICPLNFDIIFSDIAADLINSLYPPE